jgi:hypothetical protein
MDEAEGGSGEGRERRCEACQDVLSGERVEQVEQVEQVESKCPIGSEMGLGSELGLLGLSGRLEVLLTVQESWRGDADILNK